MLLCLLRSALGSLGSIATVGVGSPMLFHIVLAGEGLVALGAERILPSGVLLGVTSSVSRGGEVVVAVEGLCHGTRIAVLLGSDIGRGTVRTRFRLRPG